MLFICVEDFFSRAAAEPRVSREEEMVLARRWADGDGRAREALVRGYLSLVAARLHRAPRELQSLHTVYACLNCLERGVDTFDFLREGADFSRYLYGRLRQCLVRCLAQRC